nr:GIY-YIG nuclease family protein [uncultured Roseateles sp.]
MLKETADLRYYVYAHLDPDGRVFYVGKGTGNRAWSTDRHIVWHRYVDHHLGGNYSVNIIQDGLSEDEALEIEAGLISKLGHQLVNWENPGRAFDFQALEKYHEMRNANRQFFSETKPLEKTATALAIDRYKAAIVRMKEYETLTLERGLVAELAGPNTWGDVEMLDRLTICMQSLSMHKELLEACADYFATFPDAASTTRGITIVKRMKRAKEKIETA